MGARAPLPSPASRAPDAVDNAEILELRCEVLIPAALQNQIPARTRAGSPAACSAEARTGPPNLEADAILDERGIFVVPDILANAGGVTVLLLRVGAGPPAFFWTEEEVNSRLINLMQRAFSRCARARGLAEVQPAHRRADAAGSIA